MKAQETSHTSRLKIHNYVCPFSRVPPCQIARLHKEETFLFHTNYTNRFKKYRRQFKQGEYNFVLAT